MKKKLMILFLIVVGSSMCIFGCGNQNSPKQEVVKEETLEPKEKEQKEEKVQEEGKEQKTKVEQEEKEQKIEYKLGVTNLENTEYIPRPLEKIGEEGNPLEISENYLGYYSNGYVGYDIKQINGYRLLYDIIEFGYRIGSGSIEMIEENSSGIKCSFYPSMEEKTEFILTPQGFSISSTDQLLPEPMLAIEDATYYIVQEAGKNVNGISNFLKYELGEYKKTEPPKTIYNLTFNGAERVDPEAKKEKGIPSWEEYDNILQEKLNRVKGTNTQLIKNRRDHDKYPKYIKYIPTSKYYVNANELEGDKIILMEVLSGEEATYEAPYIAPDVNAGKAGTFDSTYAITEEERNQEEANQYWENGGNSSERLNSEYNIKVRLTTYYKADGVYKEGFVGLADKKKTFTLASFNYDVPELVGMLIDDGHLLCDGDASSGYKYFNLDCTDVENGNLKIKSNMVSFYGIRVNGAESQNEQILELSDTSDTLEMKEITEEELNSKGIDLIE